MSNLKKIPEEIYKLFDQKTHHEINEANLDEFCVNLRDLIKKRLAKADPRTGTETLRFSNIGKPDRQLWYAHNEPEHGEELTGKTQFKFMYGDVIEQLILFLVKETGKFTVTDEQLEIEQDGVKGHLDAVIDGVVVDVKSASPHAFKKFSKGTLFSDDPFGYVGQISGYRNVVTPRGPGPAFLAVDKVDGSIAILDVPKDMAEEFQPAPRIKYLKEMLDQPNPPKRCYSDVEDGKSGNMKLMTNCGYCAFKHRCWPGVRTFLYSTGPRFLTKVVRQPDVPEVLANGEMDDEIPFF